MKMTKIGIVAAVCGLIVAGVGTTQAQGVGKAGRAGLRGKALKQQGGKHLGELAQLLTQLNLTADQKKQVATIATNARQQRQSIQQNASLSAADKKAQEKTLSKETRKQIVAILTPEQKKQLKQLIAQRRQMKAGKGTIATPGTTPGTTAPGTTTSPSTPSGSGSAPKTGSAAPSGDSASGAKTAKTDEDDVLDGLDDLT